MSPRRDSLSTLFATSSTGRFARRNHSATFASSSVTPTVASTTRITDVGLAHGALAICALTFSSRVDPPGSHPPVSTTLNSVPCHSASKLLAIAGDTRKLFDDRVAPPDDPVHERRLADVRASDDRDDGEPTLALMPALLSGRPRRQRSATPSVATTSTGRGRSAGVEPSRNSPSDRHTSGSR